MIIQNAIKHWSGRYLNLVDPNTKIQYEDTKGGVLVFTGGLDYLKRSTGFPGHGCEDYTLTALDSFELVAERLLFFSTKQLDWYPIRLLTVEELYQLRDDLSDPLKLQVVSYWINQYDNTICTN